MDNINKIAFAIVLGIVGFVLFGYAFVTIETYQNGPFLMRAYIPVADYYFPVSSLCVGLALIICAIFLYRSSQKETKVETLHPK